MRGAGADNSVTVICWLGLLTPPPALHPSHISIALFIQKRLLLAEKTGQTSHFKRPAEITSPVSVFYIHCFYKYASEKILRHTLYYEMDTLYTWIKQSLTLTLSFSSLKNENSILYDILSSAKHKSMFKEQYLSIKLKSTQDPTVICVPRKKEMQNEYRFGTTWR